MKINNFNLSKFKKWLNENQTKKANFYVLVGPPAVGKSTWVKNTFKGKTKGVDYELISKDDVIEELFPSTKLSNKELYNLKPEDDTPHKDYGEVITYNFRDKERKQYKKIYDTNKKINDIISNKIKNAISKNIDIVIDGMHKNEAERQQALKNVSDNSNYKKIAVYFPFSSISDLEKRAEKRAEILRKKYGDKFDRSISRQEYEDITSKITVPSTSEGFDEIVSSDFKDQNMDKDITAESLTLGFRKWMNEGMIQEASVREISLKHKIPKDFAKHAKNKCSSKNVSTILEIFLENYQSMITELTSEAANDKDKLLIDNYILEFDRYMGFAGSATDKYLKKHNGKKHKQELIELSKKSWTSYLRKIREYNDSLKESKMTKYWRRKAKERAKRHEREYPNKIDKVWAQKQQKRWNKEPELEEAYLKEIEAAEQSTKATRSYLEKIKMLRKNKLEAKRSGMAKPKDLPKASPKRPPPLEKRKHNKLPDGPYIAPGENFGNIAEEEINNE